MKGVLGSMPSGTANPFLRPTSAQVRASTLTLGGTLVVKATDASDIFADVGAAALAISIGRGSGGSTTAAVGVAVAVNSISNDVLANLDDTDVFESSSVEIRASSATRIEALGLAGSASVGADKGTSFSGGLAFAGVVIVNLVDNTGLDYDTNPPGYTVFGHVVEGMDVIDAIGQVATGSEGGMSDVPLEDIAVTSAERVASGG